LQCKCLLNVLQKNLSDIWKAHILNYNEHLNTGLVWYSDVQCCLLFRSSLCPTLVFIVLVDLDDDDDDDDDDDEMVFISSGKKHI
jgi:hypothetical protein